MDSFSESTNFIPTTLLSMRRTSTGSLSSLKKQNQDSNCNYRSSSHHRHNPIAGGSWDDNSVGHGTVAARMRRERNRVIRQTQSSSSYTSNTFNTHAHITSTLNLINTTALSPWQHHHLFPWDDDYDLTTDCVTAATKRSAGSLFNIPTTSVPPSWDARSIPEHAKARQQRRTPYRHSYTSAYLHSSPASGCPSKAGSDIDSSDLACFSMTDDSSLFDGDSLFSDSYGVLECDSGFSTNIYNLLEEGTISCRTPFLNTDWTDSVSELDFDCSEQQGGDISNCDAKSDIGPSCSAPDERNRLKKRHTRLQETEDKQSQGKYERTLPDILRPTRDLKTTLHEAPPIESDSRTPVQCSSSLMLNHSVDVNSFLQTKISSSNKVKVENKKELPISTENIFNPVSSSAAMQINVVDEKPSVLECEISTPARKLNICETKEKSFHEQDVDKTFSVEQTLASNLGEWNNLPHNTKLALVEQLSEKISKTMGLQEQLDIIHILGTNNLAPFRMSIDDIDSHKLSRVLGYLDSHKSAESHRAATPTNSTNESNLRRSNSDGNIAKSLSDAQKEHRRRQRQARRFAKWLKQRQRKENRQQLKEQRSGLFLKEEKVKIELESEEIEVDV